MRASAVESQCCCECSASARAQEAVRPYEALPAAVEAAVGAGPEGAEGAAKEEL